MNAMKWSDVLLCIVSLLLLLLPTHFTHTFDPKQWRKWSSAMNIVQTQTANIKLENLFQIKSVGNCLENKHSALIIWKKKNEEKNPEDGSPPFWFHLITFFHWLLFRGFVHVVCTADSAFASDTMIRSGTSSNEIVLVLLTVLCHCQ